VVVKLYDQKLLWGWYIVKSEVITCVNVELVFNVSERMYVFVIGC
jgi:hypothetical protein